MRLARKSADGQFEQLFGFVCESYSKHLTSVYVRVR